LRKRHFLEISLNFFFSTGRKGLTLCKQQINHNEKGNLRFLQVNLVYKLTMTWSLTLCKQRINHNEKRRRITGNFDSHVGTAVRRVLHRPIEHIRGFTRSHWMPPSVECLRQIAPAAAMVDYFRRKHKTLTKNYF